MQTTFAAAATVGKIVFLVAGDTVAVISIFESDKLRVRRRRLPMRTRRTLDFFSDFSRHSTIESSHLSRESILSHLCCNELLSSRITSLHACAKVPELTVDELLHGAFRRSSNDGLSVWPRVMTMSQVDRKQPFYGGRSAVILRELGPRWPSEREYR